MIINTRLLLGTSGVAMTALGLGLTFLPHELAESLSISTTGAAPVVVQMLGALYVAYGMLNWIAKGNPMGGIYGRPIGLANLTHFLIGGLALARGAADNQFATPVTAAAAVYALFAVLFAIVVFGPPPFARDG